MGLIVCDFMINFNVGEIIVTKKAHPCGCNRWEILRVGADFKLKCLKCGRLIMLPAEDFLKRIKINDKGKTSV